MKKLICWLFGHANEEKCVRIDGTILVRCRRCKLPLRELYWNEYSNDWE